MSPLLVIFELVVKTHAHCQQDYVYRRSTNAPAESQGSTLTVAR
jgi:hypothetical protein